MLVIRVTHSLPIAGRPKVTLSVAWCALGFHGLFMALHPGFRLAPALTNIWTACDWPDELFNEKRAGNLGTTITRRSS
jgi:hypothetical protein